jgi:hypothetical protein
MAGFLYRLEMHMTTRPAKPWASSVWILHAIYALVTGIWPLVHLRSFEAVSGPKADGWLVKTVGILVGVIGGVIALAGTRKRISPEITGLAIGSSIGLAAIDVINVTRGRISRVYLLDAMVQCLLIGGWIVAVWRERRMERLSSLPIGVFNHSKEIHP